MVPSSHKSRVASQRPPPIVAIVGDGGSRLLVLVTCDDGGCSGQRSSHRRQWLPPPTVVFRNACTLLCCPRSKTEVSRRLPVVADHGPRFHLPPRQIHLRRFSVGESIPCASYGSWMVYVP